MDILKDIKILYEDNDCLVLNKPAGLMVHSDGRSVGPFLTDWIGKNYPETKGVGEPITDEKGNLVDRPGIVHRLDRETSGAIIIAKNQKSYENLKKQFQEHSVKKKYLAIVWGEMKEDFGTINRPIGRSSSDFRKFSATRGARGEMREAETYWTKIATESYESTNSTNATNSYESTNKRKDTTNATNLENNNEKFTVIIAEPKTGRTHQIRVHLRAVNHPVVGDSLYASGKPYVLGMKRLALHSKSLEFNSISGKKVVVEAPLPADLIQALKTLGIESL